MAKSRHFLHFAGDGVIGEFLERLMAGLGEGSGPATITPKKAVFLSGADCNASRAYPHIAHMV